MKAHITSTLREVPADDWDRLARSAGLYLSHRWLLGEESDPTATASYALVHDGDGTLLAAAPSTSSTANPTTSTTRTCWSCPARPDRGCSPVPAAGTTTRP